MSVKEAVLSSLIKNAGSFISGEELSNSMDVSRTAIWKAIKALKDEGHIIEAVTNKGYMLVSTSDLVTETSLREALPDKYKGNCIQIYNTLGSTNTHAKHLALDGAPHGTVVLAHQQTEGKGRLGRSFDSPLSGIYLSMVIKPSFDPMLSTLITNAAAVAVSEAIDEVCGLESRIKWVNDIYISGKKVCGILSEGLTDFETGQIESIIVGIGINTSSEALPESLRDIAGAVDGDYSKASLAAAVISKALNYIDSLESRSFMAAYKERNLVVGKTVTVYKGIYKNDPSEVPSFSARVLDIDDDGGLVVLYSDGSRETLISGEISIRW